jgi:hypothetical protein
MRTQQAGLAEPASARSDQPQRVFGDGDGQPTRHTQTMISRKITGESRDNHEKSRVAGKAWKALTNVSLGAWVLAWSPILIPPAGSERTFLRCLMLLDVISAPWHPWRLVVVPQAERLSLSRQSCNAQLS